MTTFIGTITNGITTIAIPIGNALGALGSYTVSVIQGAGTFVATNPWAAGSVLVAGNVALTYVTFKIVIFVEDRFVALLESRKVVKKDASIWIVRIIASATLVPIIVGVNVAAAYLLPLHGIATGAIAIATVGLTIIGIAAKKADKKEESKENEVKELPKPKEELNKSKEELNESKEKKLPEPKVENEVKDGSI